VKFSVRLFACLLAVLLAVCVLAACGSEPEVPANDVPVQTQPSNVEGAVISDDSSAEDEVAKVYEMVANLNILPEMLMLGDDYTEAYYGISLDSVSNKVFAIAEDSLIVDTVIIVEVSANGNADDIVNAFRTINNQKLLELESYNPAQYERATNAVIEAAGSYVYYVITDDNAAVVSTIRSGLGL